MNVRIKKILSMLLTVVMLMSAFSSVVPMNAAGVEEVPSILTYVSSQVTPLAPGVEETKYTVFDAQGDQIIYYAITADIASTDTVEVKANYHDNDNTGVWGKATVVEQANSATAKRGYNVVASTNASYYNVSTGQPTGGFVMEGVNINGDSMGNSYPFFAIMKDGTAMIGQKGTFSQYSANIQEAVGGWQMLVWNGAVVATNNTSKYPRSTVGVKANGDVVLMVADGNQKPYSAGLTYVEQANIMLSLGCVAAVELDGGGSATYAAKPEGTDEIVVRNSCCDGTVRSVSNTLMVISTAVADGTFDHANLSVDYSYYAPYSSVAVNALGADKGGYPAEIPGNVSWAVSDESFGTVENGVFNSTGKIGTVTVSMYYDGAEVGQVDVSIAHPTEIAFQAEKKMVPYGRPSDFTVDATHNGAVMYVSPDAFYFECTAGSMEGFLFTAPDEGPKNATVTATYKYAEIAQTVIEVEFGRGSDILFDFEEGITGWGDYFDMVDAANKGEYTNGYSVIYESEGSNSGNLVENGIHENVFLADKENGKVYRGDYSLAYTVDYRYSQAHANWQYAYLYYWGEPIVLKDVENGIAGTRLGMWMYIPEEAVGSCARFAYTYQKSDGTYTTAYLYFTYQYVEKGFSKLTSEKIPEAGWAYVYVDMSQISETYVSTSYYKHPDGSYTREPASNYAPAFIQFIVSSSATGAEKCTFYIDDITLDYSDAVDDRDMPIISNPLILEDQDSYAIDGRTLNYNTITVTADAKEDTSRGTNYTGLNEATAQVYVDGHNVDTKFAGGKISATGIVLPNGTHDITFEIADKQGNYTKLTKQIVIDAESSQPYVVLNGAAAALKPDGMIYTGGQYNMTLDTDKVEGIDSVSFKLWLNSASEWALEHMTVLPGFEVEYTLDENSCTADITVSRVSSTATGAATLLTIPVYAWSWNEELGLCSAATQWNSNGCAPQIAVSYKVKYGNVEYTAEYAVNNSAYVAGFSNKRVDAKTELNSSIANLKNTIGTWHYHTEVALEDLTATCVADGYTGRTVCSVCNSVVNWGTTVTASGHVYVVDATGEKAVLVCEGCGEVVSGTGFYNGKNGEIYYVQNGTLATDWVVISYTGTDRDYYYFDKTTYAAYVGVYTIDGVEYEFDETGKQAHAAFVEQHGGIRCYFGGHFLTGKWVEEEEGTYWVDPSGFVAFGNCAVKDYLAAPIVWYNFDETTGLLQGICNGFFEYQGEKYWCDSEGHVTYGAVVLDDGIIFCSIKGRVSVNESCYIGDSLDSKGGLADGYYYCDENGYIVANGFISAGGNIYYMVDYNKAKGFVKIGDDYYIFNANNGTMYSDKTIWVGTNDYGIAPGNYYFDADGKMFVPDVVNGERKIIEENGSLYFTIDGVKMYGGLYELDGDYYYATSDGTLATDVVRWVSVTNDLVPVGYYKFEADGKLMKTGFMTTPEGYTYYFDDLQKVKGFVKIEDKYYYFNANSGMMYSDVTMWVGANEYGVTPENYYFGIDGAMVIFEIDVEVEGTVITILGLHDIRDVWISNGDCADYNEVNANRVFRAPSGSTRITADGKLSYNVQNNGTYTIFVRYANGGEYREIIECDDTVNAYKNIITIDELDDTVKDVFVSYGVCTTYGEIKAGMVYHLPGTSYKIVNGSWSYMVPENGTYTVYIRHYDGSVRSYTVECDRGDIATLAQDGNTVTFTGLDNLYVLRYVKGTYSTSAQVKRAAGCRNVSPDAISDGTWSVTLNSGVYTFVTQFVDGNYVFYTVTVE